MEENESIPAETSVVTTDADNDKLFVAGVEIPLNERYFKDGKPLSLDDMAKLVNKDIKEINTAFARAMFDLFVIHENWTGFYKHHDSFKEFLKKNINISRSYAYSIIGMAQALKAYFVKQGKMDKQIGNFDDFIKEVQAAVDKNGIKKMIAVSHIRKASERDKLLETALQRAREGKKLEDTQEAKHEAEAEEQKKAVSENRVILQSTGKPVLKFFVDAPEDLKEQVRALVSKYGQSESKPKKPTIPFPTQNRPQP
jgi:hypothetical protein